MPGSDHALRRALLEDSDQSLASLEDLAARTGLSPTILEALAREGLLLSRGGDGHERYHVEDADAVKAGLDLVTAGLPLAELLAVARQADQAMRPVAEAAVDAFVRYVTDPLEGTSTSPDEAAEKMVAAFEVMLPAAGRLVQHHFERLLLEGARRRLEQ